MQLLIAPGKFATDPHYAAQLQTFHHNDPLPNAHNPPGNDDRITPASLEPHITKCLKSLAPRRQTGPDASRNEHWKPLCNFPQYHLPLATILQRIATGNIPDEPNDDTLEAILTTTLGAKLKNNGKIRPLGIPTALRRLTAKAVLLQSTSEIQTYLHPTQSGIGTPDGANIIHKTLNQIYHNNPDYTLLHFDMSDAFTNLPRETIVKHTPHACPTLTQLTNTWYTVPSATIWKDSEDTYHHLKSQRGTTQGCTMSAAIFAIALQPTLHKIRDKINQRISHYNQTHGTNHICHLHAYLDDMYLAIPTDYLNHALTTVQEEVNAAKLTLNLEKTEMCTTGTPHPDHIQDYTKTFTIMGSTPTEVRAAAEDEHVPQETVGTPLDDITPHGTLLITQAHALTKLTYMNTQQHIDTRRP